MFWTPLFSFFAWLLGGLYALLPFWPFVIGDGSVSDDSASDRGFIRLAFGFLGPWDRLLPVHDGLIPLMALSGVVALGAGIYKLICHFI